MVLNPALLAERAAIGVNFCASTVQTLYTACTSIPRGQTLQDSISDDRLDLIQLLFENVMHAAG